MPLDDKQNIPYSDSIALVNALTGGRGMPTGATGIDRARWYHDPRLANIPGIQSIGQLISGAPGQVAPSEGVTPVTGMADPIANIAGILAPFMKAYLSRQVTPGQGMPSLSLAGQRGSTGGSEGEDTFASFKRMFMDKRYNPGSDTYTPIPKVTESQLIERSLRDTKMSDFTKLRDMYSDDYSRKFFVSELRRKYTPDQVKELIDNEVNKPFLDLTNKLMNVPTKDKDKLLGYVQSRVDPTTVMLDETSKTGLHGGAYIDVSDKGYTLNKLAVQKAIYNHLSGKGLIE